MKVKENAEPRVLAEGSALPDKPDKTGETSPPGDAAAPSLSPSLSEDELRASIEALLYAAEEPLSVKDLAKALPEVPREAIKTCIEELVGDLPGAGTGTPDR